MSANAKHRHTSGPYLGFLGYSDPFPNPSPQPNPQPNPNRNYNVPDPNVPEPAGFCESGTYVGPGHPSDGDDDGCINE